MKKEINKRKNLLSSIESDIFKRIEFMEREFFRLAYAHLVEVLDIDESRIVNKTSNFVVLNSLAKFKKEFSAKKVTPLLLDMAKKFVKVALANTQYFKSIVKVSPSKANKIEAGSLAKIGLRRVDNKIQIVSGGWLNQVGDFNDAYLKVREAAQTAIAGNVKIKDMKRLVKKSVLPDSKFGPIKHHLITNVVDSYAQFDRMAQKDYADELGFRAFIYQGGTITTTRDFCRKRNGTVITLEEAEQWREMSWDGKNENYEPLRDMGGHRCRHFASFISDKLAISRRPELADIWGIKTKENV